MSASDAREAVYTARRTVVAALDRGTDLLEEIERLVRENDLAFCRVSGLGSLAAARVTYYDQAAKEDRDIVFEQPMMLVTLTGTVLRAGGDIEAHCHLVVGDERGVSYGGDLSPGCVVFSGELMFIELVGPPVSRRTDDGTGLARLTFG
jgi:predicted DNA-binding protein with PD1-like motif